MATPPSDNIIGRITTKEIGDLLDNDFPDDLDVPIDYFYVQVRKEYMQEMGKHDTTAEIENWVSQNADTGIESIKKLSGRKWPSTYFVKFPMVRNPQSQQLEKLREQEKRLNTKFRLPLKLAIDQQLLKIRQSLLLQGRSLPENPPVAHIIITRVCKYMHHPGNFAEDEIDSDVDSDNDM